MADIQLDDRGIVVACPSCGKKNRIQYERLGDPVPEWVRRLFVLRSVSGAEEVPCQDAYFAAT